MTTASHGLAQATGSALPWFVCQTCGHDWDNARPHCVSCGTPYRVPNPERNANKVVAAQPNAELRDDVTPTPKKETDL